MPSLTEVRQSNSLLKQGPPGLVAVFAGATGGIGEATCKEFTRLARSPRVYIVGRNPSKGSTIVQELRSINPQATVRFIEADLTLLRNADLVFRIVSEKESKVNLLFLTSGFLSLQGRRETTEGLDMMLSLQYFSRMRLITNFLPLLLKAAGAELARVVSVLGAGKEVQIAPDDIEVINRYDLRTASNQAITMTSLAMDQLATSHSGISFLHVYPGVVRGTGIMQGMGRVISSFARFAMTTVARPFTVGLDESGQRHVYAATSEAFAPSKRKDGRIESSFRLAWNGEPCGPNPVLSGYRADGTQNKIWELTLAVSQRVAIK